MSSNYTSGSIRKVMLRTAVSMLMGTLAISGYNLVDTYFVSKLGSDSLAAMGYTFPMVMLIGCIYRGLDMGIMTPIAQYLGGNRRQKAARMVSSGVILLSAVAILIGITGSCTIEPTFRSFGASATVMPMIKKYMIIWYLGSLTGALGVAGNGILVSSGAAKSAGFMMMFGMVLNAILDPLFIFGFGPVKGAGIAGAAIATVLSQIIALMVVVYILHYRLHLIASFKIPWSVLLRFWKTVLRYGIPSILSMLLMPLGSAVITASVAYVGGDLAVAAVAAGGRVEVVAFIFPMSLGIALMPMVAQNFGAKNFDRIDQCRRFSMRFAGIMLLIMAGIYCLCAPYIAKFFTNDPEVLAILCCYLRIIPWGFAGQEIHRFGGFFLTGTGHPLAAAILNSIRVLVFLIPLTLLSVLAANLTGIFVARLIADLCSGVIALVWSRSLTKKLLS